MKAALDLKGGSGRLTHLMPTTVFFHHQVLKRNDGKERHRPLGARGVAAVHDALVKRYAHASSLDIYSGFLFNEKSLR